MRRNESNRDRKIEIRKKRRKETNKNESVMVKLMVTVESRYSATIWPRSTGYECYSGDGGKWNFYVSISYLLMY
jgi:hypothetical protein